VDRSKEKSSPGLESGLCEVPGRAGKHPGGISM